MVSSTLVPNTLTAETLQDSINVSALLYCCFQVSATMIFKCDIVNFCHHIKLCIKIKLHSMEVIKNNNFLNTLMKHIIVKQCAEIVSSDSLYF